MRKGKRDFQRHAERNRERQFEKPGRCPTKKGDEVNERQKEEKENGGRVNRRDRVFNFLEGA